ncbi:hypothetical protein D3C80_1454730 [compost metagenome]
MPPPTRARATMVSSGKPTPVSRKPSAAGSRFSPAARPALGGKMMLPAPRNRAKVMKPRARRSELFKRVIEGNTTGRKIRVPRVSRRIGGNVTLPVGQGHYCTATRLWRPRHDIVASLTNLPFAWHWRRSDCRTGVTSCRISNSCSMATATPLACVSRSGFSCENPAGSALAIAAKAAPTRSQPGRRPWRTNEKGHPKVASSCAVSNA